MCTQSEMPKYQCHKKVHALKIKLVSIGDNGSGLITPEDQGYDDFTVSKEFMDKHNPTFGGYFVVYKGGYQSFRPAKEFEEGYRKLAGE